MAKGWGGLRPGAGRKKNGGPNGSAKRKAKSEDKKRFVIDRFKARQIIAMSAASAARQRGPQWNPFQLPQFPPQAVPPKKHQMAMDFGFAWGGGQWSQGYLGQVGAEGLLFMGYPFLSELAQRPEYRIITETIATEMTREWIKIKVTGSEVEEDEEGEQFNEPEDDDDDAEGGESGGEGEQYNEPGEEEGENEKTDVSGEDALPGQMPEGQEKEQPQPQPGAAPQQPGMTPQETAESEAEAEEKEQKREEREKRKKEKADKIKQIEDEFERLQVRDHFKLAAIHDGFFGRGHIFLDFGQDEAVEPGELATPIGNSRNEMSRQKIPKGSLRAIRNVEPVWTYPTTYNATNPLQDDWYNPQVWYVMGQQVHASRLLTFIARPVPDMLKPAYAFGGLSMSQLAKPYVDIWLKTRKSVGDLIHSFSVMVLKTDMQADVQLGGDSSLMARVDMFNALRDNNGTFVLNNATEDFMNVSASLGGLHELQAQAQEHMASVARIPLVKFTGISPTGLNASSEGEMRAYYDTIHAYQENFFRPNLTQGLQFCTVIAVWRDRR